MAELTIRPEEIQAALDGFASSYEPAQAVTEEVGYVTLTADGIARVNGLAGTMANELLAFEDGTPVGVAFVELPQRDNRHVAFLSVVVAVAHRGRRTGGRRRRSAPGSSGPGRRAPWCSRGPRPSCV